MSAILVRRLMASRKWLIPKFDPPKDCCVCGQQLRDFCYYKQYWFVCSHTCYDVLIELGIVEEQEG